MTFGSFKAISALFKKIINDINDFANDVMNDNVIQNIMPTKKGVEQLARSPMDYLFSEESGFRQNNHF